MNVCFDSNIIDAPSDTWWLDSGATIHACNSMQAVISRRSPTSLEYYVYMRNGIRVKVDFLGVVRLPLSIRNFLELQDVAFIPLIKRNLISVPILDKLGYNFLFGIGKVKLYRDSLLISTGVLCGNLYRLEWFVLPSVSATIYVNIVSSKKHLRLNGKSYTLWYKHLGHISRHRMERLIKDEILPDLDFSDFDTCVEFIKGKLTAKVRNVKVDRCTELLGVIHTDICVPFTPSTMGG